MSPDPDYAFTNSAAQMTPLTGYLDPLTVADLNTIDIRQGWRCLSLGAGAGTIATRLFDRVAPTGEVIAVDLDTSLLRSRPGLKVVQHDLRGTTALPVAGPFQLVEARLLTQHLPNRRELLQAMIGLTPPGGWLLLGEFVNPRPRTLFAPTVADGDLVNRVIGALLDSLENAGVDMDWGGREVHGVLAEAGATVHTRWHCETWTGGSDRIHLLADNAHQKREQLLAAGVTTGDLDRFAALLQDPQLTVRSYEIALTRAQLPR